MNVAIRNIITEILKKRLIDEIEKNDSLQNLSRNQFIYTNSIPATKHYLTNGSDPRSFEYDSESELHENDVYSAIFHFIKRSIGDDFIDQVIHTLFQQRYPKSEIDLKKAMCRIINDFYGKEIILSSHANASYVRMEYELSLTSYIEFYNGKVARCDTLEMVNLRREYDIVDGKLTTAEIIKLYMGVEFDGFASMMRYHLDSLV